MPPSSAVAVEQKPNKKSASEEFQGVRETVESIVVAFVLAFLFRAFVAEAFVITTGSMAPTLMGAHKDLVCEHCGRQYQTGASNEFESDSGRRTNDTVVATVCSNCRGLNKTDLRGNANDSTFSGDRILVSKFDYVLHNPERWDVIVFKYPLAARMNYIKRLVGLPGETVKIQGGDVFVRTEETQPWTIARKPPHKIRAMRQIVSDTDKQPEMLVASGWPSLWQPWSAEDVESADGWKVTHSPTHWSAELPASPSAQWLRYYHKFLTFAEWENFEATGLLPEVEPRSSRLVTDFQAYNSAFSTFRSSVYDSKGKLQRHITEETRAYDTVDLGNVWTDSSRTRLAMHLPLNDGDHWVGDLIGEFDVAVQGSTGTLSLLLVESGVEFRCDFDVATGKATLQATDGQQAAPIFADGKAQLTADTPVRGAGSYRLEYANIDDQIVLWVNGKVVKFSSPAEYDLGLVRDQSAKRPHWTEANPLDAAPIAVGAQSLAVKVERAQVWRDIYYIAIGNTYTDFNLRDSGELRSSSNSAAIITFRWVITVRPVSTLARG